MRKLTLPLGSDFAIFREEGPAGFSALLVDGAKVDGGFEVSREGRMLTVKPDGLTTDDVGAGSMVRLEWEQAEVNLDRFAEGRLRCIDFSASGYSRVDAGVCLRLCRTDDSTEFDVECVFFCEGNGGSYSLRSVFSTMEKASLRFWRTGFMW